MSKTHLLISKKTPFVSIANKPRNVIQNTITHREPLKDEDSQKLYTFCSSEQKQQMQPLEEEASNVSRERKTSFNNVRGKMYQPLSRSKGKTVSQVNITKGYRKETGNCSISNNNSLLLNNSTLIERRKTDKMTAREQKKDEKMINISINLNRNCLNEHANKENNQEHNAALQEKVNLQEKRATELAFNKEKEFWNEGGKRMVVMSEQELQNFTKKQAADKLQLEQAIDRLEQRLKGFEEKEVEWKHFKKDSQDYIKYLVKEKEQVLAHYDQLKQEVIQLSNDKEYYQLAKEEYRNTIHEQESEIHSLKKEISDVGEEKRRLEQQIQAAEAKMADMRDFQTDQTGPMHMLEIENLHLRKELEINEKHQSLRASHMMEGEELRKRVQELSSTNQVLSSEMKEMYIFKLKCEVFEKSLEESSNTIVRLTQENHSLKLMARSGRSTGDKSGQLSEFEFRLDTSPHSPSEVEVVWKRDYEQEGKSSLQGSVHEYFDHDFFSGFTKHKQ